MKKLYIAPVISLKAVEVKDIITLSIGKSDGSTNNNDIIGWGDGENF